LLHRQLSIAQQQIFLHGKYVSPNSLLAFTRLPCDTIGFKLPGNIPQIIESQSLST